MKRTYQAIRILNQQTQNVNRHQQTLLHVNKVILKSYFLLLRFIISIYNFDSPFSHKSFFDQIKLSLLLLVPKYGVLKYCVARKSWETNLEISKKLLKLIGPKMEKSIRNEVLINEFQ